MLQLTTPMGRLTIFGSPWISLDVPTRTNVDQVCESYKYKIAGEKLLERLGTHQDPDAVHSVLLKDLDPQTFRERVQDQTFIHKKKRPEFIEKRKKQMATEALVLREYNAGTRKRGLMAKIAKDNNLTYDTVRDIIRKHNKLNGKGG